MTVDTEQHSRSKEHQLCTWKQQDTWIQMSRLPGLAAEANEAVFRSYAGTHARNTGMVSIARKRAPTSVDKTTSQSKTETLGLD